MSNLKRIGASEQFGSVFSAYADLARACGSLGLLDKDQAFVEVAMKMIKHCQFSGLPDSLVQIHGDYQASKRDYDEILPRLAEKIRGSQRDVFLYHLYGLMTHRQYDLDLSRRDSQNTTLTQQRKKWVMVRSYLDAESLGLAWPDSEETEKVRRILTGFASKPDPDNKDVWLNENAPVGFSVENPGHLSIFFREPTQTALIGFVHGRPFYFLNTPYRSKSDTDRWHFDRDEITVVHGFDRTEILRPSPNESPDGTIVEYGDQKFYTCIPSQQKAGHIARYLLPQNERTRNPTAFLNEIMAPKIREEYGRLLPRPFHVEGIERCMEGDFDLVAIDLQTGNSRIEREAAAIAAKREFYADEDVGMF